MQTPTRMDKVVIEDYYHTTKMNENMNWMELMHLLSNFFLLTLRPPFVHLPLRQHFEEPF
jgi:hypothetical protein